MGMCRWMTAITCLAGALASVLVPSQHNFGAPCPTDWIFFNKSCYYTSDYRVTWDRARRSCKEVDRKSDLISLHSQEEQDFIIKMMYWEVWIGLNSMEKDHAWTWSDGTPANYFLWDDEYGRPEDHETEQCVALVLKDSGSGEDVPKNAGTFVNTDCEEVKHFVCMATADNCPDNWEYRRGFCYWVSHFKGTWEQGRHFCKLINPESDLTSIHRKEDITPIIEKMHWRSWIGLDFSAYESKWHWTDGSDLTFLNWGEHQPMPEHEEHLHCTELPYSGYWNSENCNRHLHYTCKLSLEYNPPRETLTPRR